MWPDFSKVTNPDLLISAMGQAFFHVSWRRYMLVWLLYQQKKNCLTGASVALVDIGVAILAGLLIIPAMYVAMQWDSNIYRKW